MGIYALTGVSELLFFETSMCVYGCIHIYIKKTLTRLLLTRSTDTFLLLWAVYFYCLLCLQNDAKDLSFTERARSKLIEAETEKEVKVDSAAKAQQRSEKFLNTWKKTNKAFPKYVCSMNINV